MLPRRANRLGLLPTRQTDPRVWAAHPATPQIHPRPQFPTAFLYLGCWFLMAGVVYYFFGLETKGKSMQQIDRELAAAD